MKFLKILLPVFLVAVLLSGCEDFHINASWANYGEVESIETHLPYVVDDEIQYLDVFANSYSDAVDLNKKYPYAADTLGEATVEVIFKATTGETLTFNDVSPDELEKLGESTCFIITRTDNVTDVKKAWDGEQVQQSVDFSPTAPERCKK